MTPTQPRPRRRLFEDFLASFVELKTLPAALWLVIGVFVIESMAYFGVLTLMTNYLSANLNWGDRWSGLAVSIFTMLVTLFMLGVGSWAEKFGLRRAILTALLLSLLGRAIFWLAPGFPGGLASVAVGVSLIVVAMGSGILTPSCYSGVKQYTNEKTHSMGYALIYAFMNLGLVGIGALSAWIRPEVQRILDHQPGAATGGLPQGLARISVSGTHAVIWTCAIITLVALVLFALLMTRKAEAAKLRPDPAETGAAKAPLRATFKGYFTEGPFANPRFIFFIFMLLPVRTLFAHQWLTMPEYILRAYPQSVGDRMEWLVNWINPMIIFLGVPVVTALTRRVNVYTMMIIGSLVSAAPTFLMCGGPKLSLLITYFVIFSIGEALWSARFLEYASELAPPGRVAQIPWLLAKGTTGLYSGYMLATFCPRDVPSAQLHTEWMWLIYGCLALTSPIGLWLARDWVRKGLQTRH